MFKGKLYLIKKKKKQSHGEDMFEEIKCFYQEDCSYSLKRWGYDFWRSKGGKFTLYPVAQDSLFTVSHPV